MSQEGRPDLSAFEVVGSSRSSRYGDDTVIEFGKRKDGRPTCHLSVCKDDADVLRAVLGDRCVVKVAKDGRVALFKSTDGCESRKIVYYSPTSPCRAMVYIDGAYRTLKNAYGADIVRMMIVWRDDECVVFKLPED